MQEALVGELKLLAVPTLLLHVVEHVYLILSLLPRRKHEWLARRTHFAVCFQLLAATSNLEKQDRKL